MSPPPRLASRRISRSASAFIAGSSRRSCSPAASTLRPIPDVSWNAPRPCRKPGGSPTIASTGTESERAMQPGPAVRHEGRAVLPPGQHRGQPPLTETMDPVVNVLDVRPADAEDVAHAPIAASHLHDCGLPLGSRRSDQGASRDQLKWMRPRRLRGRARRWRQRAWRGRVRTSGGRGARRTGPGRRRRRAGRRGVR